MTTKYEAVKVWVVKKDWQRLKIKLMKEGVSISLNRLGAISENGLADGRR